MQHLGLTCKVLASHAADAIFVVAPSDKNGDMPQGCEPVWSEFWQIYIKLNVLQSVRQNNMWSLLILS